MRIIVTKDGKKELVDDNSNYHNSNHSSHTFPLNSPQKKCIYDNSNLTFPKRCFSSSKAMQQKNNDQSFLSKIGMNSINFNPINYENNINIKSIKICNKKLNIPSIMLDKYNENKVLTTNNNNSEEVSSLNNSTDGSNNENDYADSLLTSSNNHLCLKDILKTKNKYNVNTRYLQKQINVEDSSLIDYLGSDRNINPFFVKKISDSNDNQLNKLDKICQVYFNKEEKDNKSQNQIKNKVRSEYKKDKQFFSKNLRDIETNLNIYRNVCQKLEVKKKNYDNFRKMFFLPPQYNE